MADFIIGGIIVVILAAAGMYIRRKKKSGAKCIGCPAGESCCSCGKKK